MTMFLLIYNALKGGELMAKGKGKQNAPKSGKGSGKGNMPVNGNKGGKKGC
jgi:hypothetical protein